MNVLAANGRTSPQINAARSLVRPRLVAFKAQLRPSQPRLATVVRNSAAPNATVAESEQKKTFMDEMRAYAMKLHTREQAPREGKAEAPKQQQPMVPTKEGYLRFLIESKVVYEAFEDIMANAPVPQYRAFVNTGLERSEPLAKDIAYMTQTWGLAADPPAADGPGASYAALLRTLAVDSPPAFICHFYNFYFAHTAGGRMIGAQVSKAALEGWVGDFYKWDGDVKELLGAVRNSMNEMAEGWSREEKDACLQETPNTFKSSGSLLRLIAGGAPAH